MRNKTTAPVVLAVQPNTRGFGFAVFEAGTNPVDWGTKKAKVDKNGECYEHLRIMLHVYAPHIVVIEDCKSSSRRSERVKELLKKFAKLAKSKDIEVARYSRKDIDACFEPYGATNKVDIARTIAQILPEFAPFVPKSRKVWTSEGYQMGLFDALALALTHHDKTAA